MTDGTNGDTKPDIGSEAEVHVTFAPGGSVIMTEYRITNAQPGQLFSLAKHLELTAQGALAEAQMQEAMQMQANAKKKGGIITAVPGMIPGGLRKT